MERPNRPDPSMVSGWNEYCEKRNSLRNIFSKTNDDREYISKILDVQHNIEKEQDDEDTAMLIRLIKVRHNLWT